MHVDIQSHSRNVHESTGFCNKRTKTMKHNFGILAGDQILVFAYQIQQNCINTGSPLGQGLQRRLHLAGETTKNDESPAA